MKKITDNYFFNLILILFIIMLNSCADKGFQTTEDDLAPGEFSEKIKQMPASPIIDVRTPEEFSEGHIENAKNINWKGNDFESRIIQVDTAAPVFVYCRSGKRSGLAADKMRSMGFKKVYELKGGISKWSEEELPVNK